MATADYYRFYVDWRKDGLLDISDFEDGTLQGWEAKGSFPPEIQPWENPGTPSGTWEMMIVWTVFNPFTFGVAGKGLDDGRFADHSFVNSATVFKFGTAGRGLDDGRFGFDAAASGEVLEPHVEKVVSGFTPGLEYTLSCTSYVFSGATGMDIALGVSGIGQGTPTATYNSYAELTYTFVATNTTHTIQIIPTGSLTTDAKICFVDRFRCIGPEVDVTDYVRDLGVDITYGRDQERNLEEIRPGSVNLTFRNLDGRFSPNNPGSPLAGLLKPGREVLIEAKFDSNYYLLYKGAIDDLNLEAGFNSTVPITSNDALGQMSEQKISTEVYPMLTSGEAVHKVLDAIKWPAEKRDIDPGASSLRFWYEEGTDALTAFKNIKESEGLPCLYGIDGRGWFYFRDRHHRLLRDRSNESSNTFYSNDLPNEPRFSPPFEYKVGFEDVINSVTASVTERLLGAQEVVWETEDSFIIPNLGEKVVTVEASNPFYAAVVPVEGVDFHAYDSGTPTVTLSRTSGKTLELKMKATGGAVTIVGMKIRANPVNETSYQVKVEDTASIDDIGLKSGTLDMTFANREDALACATVYVGHRASLLPTVKFNVNNDDNASGTAGEISSRLKAIFDTQLSDRITVTDPNSYTDRDFFVESISHHISEAGKVHVSTFACEAASAQIENVFTFDDAARGFDHGVFGLRGQLTADQLMILDQSNLDEKLLAY